MNCLDQMEGLLVDSIDITDQIFYPLIEYLKPGDVNLEEIKVSQLSKNMHFKTLKKLEEKVKTGCRVIGLKTPEGNYIINPDDSAELLPNSKHFVLGKPSQIQDLKSNLNIS